MLGHIYRLVNGFEKAHGFLPILLYLNPTHYEHLKSSFDKSFSLTNIIEILQMDIIIEADRIHPHAAWINAKQQMAS